jgi:hypothetical protein
MLMRLVALDFVLSIVGEPDPETLFSRLQLQRPETSIKDPETGAVTEIVQSNVPDLVTLNGGYNQRYSELKLTVSRDTSSQPLH